MLPFNRPPYTTREDRYVLEAMRSAKISGDGDFTRRCQAWFEARLPCARALLTPSCTQALEMAALLLGIQPGDEVIMPSYTFVSTANAFVLRGARIVFVDLRPDTMNLDETLVEAAVTDRTRALVVMHYAGVGCEMDALLDVARRHHLHVVEDAAQGMMATHHGRALGTFGALGALSFHETKNYTSGGEGGLLILNDARYVEPAEIIREKGTNRSQFFRGMVDKYSWVDLGSSYLPSELQAAYLWAQLEVAEAINADRLATWQKYHQGLVGLRDQGRIVLPTIPPGCQHNGHMLYLKVRDLAERTELLAYLKQRGVLAVFHYVPLHSSAAGVRFGRFHGVDRYTTAESERLLRLPFWYGMTDDEVGQVLDGVHGFFART
jgi:dTDP-4-amino-4,6-dideoxygalactose transaminase